MKRLIFLCLIFIIAPVSTAFSQSVMSENSTLQGLVFGDFYWIPQNHNQDLEGENGFWFRRIYLTLDTEISNSFTSRLRLEMNGEGDFLTNSKMTPVVKDAYLRWSDGQHSVTAGISPTPTFDLVEDVWGYRSVEKTPLDLQDMAGSRDFGLAANGELDQAGRWDYHFMVANGSGTGTELNQGKKIMGALGYEVTEEIVVQGYADYNAQPSDRDIYTLQGFAGYISEPFNAGLLYAHQFRKNAQLTDDLKLNMLSGFANFTLSDGWSAFLRADHMFDANPLADDIDYIPMNENATSTLVLAGVDLTLHDQINVMPNITGVFYGENTVTGLTPDTDILIKLTLQYNF